MGFTVGSIFSGVGQAIGSIFGHPLDFLSGKSCNSFCAPTWDFICYIENFCVAQLLKFVMVAILVYFVLLFFYLLFSLGICQCICRTLCHIIWAFFSTYFSAIHYCCSYLCLKLQSIHQNRRRRRRQRRRRDVEEFVVPSGSSSSSDDGAELGEMSTPRPPRNVECEGKRSESGKRKRHKEEHLRRSLRPKSHRASLELSSNSHHLHRRDSFRNVDDHIRVTRNSKFSNKGSRHRARARARARCGR